MCWAFVCFVQLDGVWDADWACGDVGWLCCGLVWLCVQAVNSCGVTMWGLHLSLCVQYLSL